MYFSDGMLTGTNMVNCFSFKREPFEIVEEQKDRHWKKLNQSFRGHFTK